MDNDEFEVHAEKMAKEFMKYIINDDYQNLKVIMEKISQEESDIQYNILKIIGASIAGMMDWLKSDEPELALRYATYFQTGKFPDD